MHRAPSRSVWIDPCVEVEALPYSLREYLFRKSTSLRDARYRRRSFHPAHSLAVPRCAFPSPTKGTPSLQPSLPGAAATAFTASGSRSSPALIFDNNANGAPRLGLRSLPQRKSHSMANQTIVQMYMVMTMASFEN